MYYIYHIPGIKIGCTTDVQRRVEFEQGYSEYEILYESECIYSASRMELQLQKNLGYPVDITPYYKSYNNRKKGNETQRITGQFKKTREKAYKKTSKKINQLDLNGNFIKTFNSFREALRSLNKSENLVKGLWLCCNGKTKTLYGYKWEYADTIL
ncbi:MAG: hypothetical protein RLY15_1542 [Bacteroidota bacterium]|jgi:hypothetical protein